MSYLPFNSIVHRLSVKRPKLVVPTHLSSVEWPWGDRVKIIPTQTFCCVDIYRHNEDISVTSRQHRMPHNSQLATTIQTTVCEDVAVKMVETFTICSTPTNGLYWSSYVLYRVGGGCGGADRLTFDKSQIACESVADSKSLEWIRLRLVEYPLEMEKETVPSKIKAIYQPLFYFGPRLC